MNDQYNQDRAIAAHKHLHATKQMLAGFALEPGWVKGDDGLSWSKPLGKHTLLLLRADHRRRIFLPQLAEMQQAKEGMRAVSVTTLDAIVLDSLYLTRACILAELAAAKHIAHEMYNDNAENLEGTAEAYDIVMGCLDYLPELGLPDDVFALVENLLRLKRQPCVFAPSL